VVALYELHTALAALASEIHWFAVLTILCASRPA
jgi:hypothetical protein